MDEKRNLKLKEIFASALKNHQENKLKIAENLYKQILNIDSNHFESIFYLGSLYVQTRNFDQSKLLLEKAISIQPNHVFANVNIAIALEELGHSKEAKEYLNKAIELQPNFPVAHFNLGNTFYKLNELENAIYHYEKTIEIDSKHFLAHNNLGLVYKELGKPLKALQCYKNSIKANPKYKRAINNISILLKEIQLTNLTKENSSNIEEIILLLFKRNDINHKDIFRSAKTFLFLEENILNQIIDSGESLLKNKVIQSLIKNELFTLMLQKTLIADQIIEKILIKLRSEILFTSIESDKNFIKENIDFIISLAEQCFLNEYVYVQSKKEIDHAKKLAYKVSTEKEINELEIAILGCYISLLSEKKIVDKLFAYKSKNNLFNDLINLQIQEPLKELELKDTIKSIEKISDDVSKKVRDQYEEYPYPRWRYTYSNSPFDFLNFFKNQIRPNKIKISHKFFNPKVLIAGCGTGNHICQAANYFNSNILGVDLSLASLSYAKRKVHELGLKNVEFLHADILQLNNLNKKFDVIESVGVLHHMRDPFKGLKILGDLLEPHGLLLLGLYSEKARQEVIKAKEFARKNNFKNSFLEIRNFRESIFKEKNDPLLQTIARGKDFYSTSSVKDLVFHAQEYRFSLSEIFKMLEDLNLEFLGFCDSRIKNQFFRQFPDDKENILQENWNQFEISNPRAFVGMYKFWARKKLTK